MAWKTETKLLIDKFQGLDEHSRYARLDEFLQWADVEGYSKLTKRIRDNDSHRSWCERELTRWRKDHVKPWILFTYASDFALAGSSTLAGHSGKGYLKLLKRAFNLAIQWEIVDMKNPAVSIQQYREQNLVENYMNDEQLRRLLTVLKTDKNRTVCDIVLFLLRTGARLNEALTARWFLIDVQHRVWRISAANSKSGKVRSVPPNDATLDVLSRQDTKDDFEYVFINRQTGKPYTTIQKVWNRLRNKADLGHIRCHDLRHSAASYMAQAGISLYIIQGVLGHSSPVVTQRYAHLSTKTLQEASDKVADTISKAMKKTA